ncbi:trissin receptor-like isoform X2 [Mercenaria mercenaria]|uniref:trissin receptor-like isoform X2 n=1 Tax=Mercenaria mercenaria TaxID=6596 RepID=UPI00234E3A02|nr:trissin receptor-like isoform X2 [Mercenaria mercenaria]
MEVNLNSTNVTFYNHTIDNNYESNGFNNPFDILHVRILFITCYAVVFAFCIGGNFMVLFAIARSPRLRSMTNFLLANLAIADFCVGTFCVLPNLSTFLQQNWILGKAMCKIYYYIWNVSYIASIIILTVIAIERYIAIIHPLKARHFMTTKRLVLVQIMTWFISLVYNIPFLIFYDTISFSEHGKEFCYSSFQHTEALKWLSLLNLIIWYIIPLLLIGFMYYRVARALWKTAVVSALRLQPYPDPEEVSTRTSNFHNDSFRNTSEKNIRQSPNLSGDKSELSHGQSLSSGESQYSEKAIFTFKGKHAVTLVCGIRERGEISPHEIICLCPNSSKSDRSDSDMAVQLFRTNEMDSQSYTRGSSFRHSRYRQTYMSNSRRVAKARKKVIRLLISVVITFGVCVLPHMMKVLNHYWMIFHLPHSVDTILSPVSFIVLYLNSVLNPFLYAIFSTNFRRSFKETLPCF